MNDDELEQILRAGLERRAGNADVAVPVADRARRAARGRRTTRLVVLGAAASVVLVVGGVVLLVGGDDAALPVATPSTGTPTTQSTSYPLATSVRTEYYGGAQVQVPSDWTWGSSPVMCGVTPVGEPYVGRPIPATDACSVADVDAVPTASYLWFGADVPLGSVDLGDGWTRETIAVEGVRITVATRDDDHLRNQVLGSAASQDLCAPELSQVPPSVFETTTEGVGDFVDGTLCAYRRLVGDGYRLVYAKPLTEKAVDKTYEAVGDAPVVEGDLDCGNNEIVTVSAQYHDNFGAPEVRLHRSDVFAFGGCGVTETAPQTDEVTVHRITEESVRPWAGPSSGGAFRHILVGPFEQWAYEYFIGIRC
ncbi:hypothetical protein BH11ACT8_BH11ACT8_24720 [soil metagenome]